MEIKVYKPKADSERSSKHLKRHAQAHSKTLIRSSVKAPKPSIKRLKIQASAYQPIYTINEALSAKATPASLERKLSHIKKSHLISHFSKVTSDDSKNPNAAKANRPTTPVKIKPSEPAVTKHVSKVDHMLEKALNDATSHLEPASKLPKKHKWSKLSHKTKKTKRSH